MAAEKAHAGANATWLPGTSLAAAAAELAALRRQEDQLRERRRRQILVVRALQWQRLKSSPWGKPEVVTLVLRQLPAREAALALPATCEAVHSACRVQELSVVPHISLHSVAASSMLQSIHWQSVLSFSLEARECPSSLEDQAVKFSRILRLLAEARQLRCLRMQLPDGVRQRQPQDGTPALHVILRATLCEALREELLTLLSVTPLVQVFLKISLVGVDMQALIDNLPELRHLEDLTIMSHEGEPQLAAQLASAMAQRCSLLRSFYGPLGLPHFWRGPAPSSLRVATVLLPYPVWFSGVCSVLFYCSALDTLKVEVSGQVMTPPTVSEHRLPASHGLSSLSLACDAGSLRAGHQVAQILECCSQLTHLSLVLLVSEASAASLASHLPPLPCLQELELRHGRRDEGTLDHPGAAACRAVALALLSASEGLVEGRVACQELGPEFMLSAVQRRPSIEEIIAGFERLFVKARHIEPTEDPCCSRALTKLQLGLSEPVSSPAAGAALSVLLASCPCLQEFEAHLAGDVADVVLDQLPALPRLSTVRVRAPAVLRFLPALLNCAEAGVFEVRDQTESFQVLKLAACEKEAEGRVPVQLSVSLQSLGECDARALRGALACSRLRKLAFALPTGPQVACLISEELPLLAQLQELEVLPVDGVPPSEGLEELAELAVALMRRSPWVLQATLCLPEATLPEWILELLQCQPRIERVAEAASCRGAVSFKLSGSEVPAEQSSALVRLALGSARSRVAGSKQAKALCELLKLATQLEELEVSVAGDSLGFVLGSLPWLPWLRAAWFHGGRADEERSGSADMGAVAAQFLAEMLQQLPRARVVHIDKSNIQITGSDEGELQELSLSLTSWDNSSTEALGLVLAASSQLQHLSLALPANTSTLADALGKLSLLPCLDSLTLVELSPLSRSSSDAAMADAATAELACGLMRQSPALSKASMPLRGPRITPWLLELLREHPHITQVVASHAAVSIAFDSARRAQRQLALVRLDLSLAKPSIAVDCHELAQLLASCPNLEELQVSLADSELPHDSELFHNWGPLATTRLQRLLLDTRKCQTSSVAALLGGGAAWSSSLLELQLSCGAVDEREAEGLAALMTACPQLQSLALRLQLCGGAVGALVSKLPQLPHLQRCSIADTVALATVEGAQRNSRHGRARAGTKVELAEALSELGAAALKRFSSLREVSLDLVHVRELPPALGIQVLTLHMRSEVWVSEVPMVLSHCPQLTSLTVYGDTLCWRRLHLAADVFAVDALCRALAAQAPPPALQKLVLNLQLADVAARQVGQWLGHVLLGVDVQVREEKHWLL